MLDSCGKSSPSVPIGIVILVAAFLLVGDSGYSETQNHRHKKTGKELGKSLRTIKNKKHEARVQLKAALVKAHGVKLDIISVDTKLEDARSHLEQTEVSLKQAKHQRELATDELAKASEELLRTRRLVSARIRRIYMEGDESMLSALSRTKSAGEVASQNFLMRAIENKDRVVFNRYIGLQHQVAKKKLEAEQKVKEVNNFESAQYAQARTLADDREDKATLLKNLQEKQQDLEEMISQFERDEGQISQEIEAYERSVAASRHNRSSKSLGVFSGRFLRPVAASITSTFGMRYHPILHRVRMHTGVDFGAAYGTPIHAAAGGDVIFSNYMNGYGHVVIIDHGGGYSTVYAHASRVFVSNGQHVTAGQTIAAVGASGLATGPHLHFEVRFHGKPINPLGKL